ncbi:hypothetical protein [Azonexus hydrophilus]|uniref:Uncharacterized protein n=1 Tax=Azonexus hydrophilus TaxID=418702 RepID=A0ABZ2XL51_9RHOO
MFRTALPVVISEPDIDAALDHLRTLPYRPNPPRPWDRQRLLAMLREAIGKSPKIGQVFDVAPGVFAIIKPFGVDLAGADAHDCATRLQVWLAIRHGGTDPKQVTKL